MRIHRREFLFASGSLLSGFWPTLAAASTSAAQHIVYPVPKPDSASAAREHLHNLATQLGREVAQHLALALNGTDRVVVYDRSGVADPLSVDAAERVARRHDRLLRDVFDLPSGAAYVATSDLLSPAYNIAYGPPGDRSTHERTYHQVVHLLGRSMEKGLEVQDLGDGTFQLIYRRLGTLERTQQVARRHAMLLGSLDLTTTPVTDANNLVVRDGTTAPMAEEPAPLADQDPLPTVDSLVDADPVAVAADPVAADPIAVAADPIAVAADPVAKAPLIRPPEPVALTVKPYVTPTEPVAIAVEPLVTPTLPAVVAPDHVVIAVDPTTPLTRVVAKDTALPPPLPALGAPYPPRDRAPERRPHRA